MNRVAGKIALVTGAASGIGAGIVHALAKEGACVIATDIDTKQGAHVIANLESPCIFLNLDTSNEQEWEDAVSRGTERFGKIDILVNNAGIPARGRIDELSLETWRKSISINLDGVFLGVRAGVRSMKETGGGSIVNISSIAGIVGSEYRSAYSAAKGGVKMLTKCAALDCAAQGWNIRVNSIHPGVIETPPVVHMLSGEGSELYREAMMRLHPMKRMGKVSDVVNGVLYLASDEASFVTGSELIIDGGATAH